MNRAGATDPGSTPQNGWVLAEMLTALVLTALFASVLLQTTACLQRCLTHWEQSTRMRQTLSVVLFRMARDFRAAGCRPMEAPAFEGAYIQHAPAGAPEEVTIRMDRRGTGTGSPPDGDIEDPGEVIVYRWDDRHRVLRRNNQPLAAGIVRNPSGVPVFRLTKDSSRGLVHLSVTTRSSGGTLSLSSAVCIRNRL